MLGSPSAKGFQLAKTEHNEVVHLTVNPGGKVPAHALPVHVTFVVLSGNGKITINDHEFYPEKLDTIEVKPHEQRLWENIGTQPLLLLVIKQLPESSV